MSNEAWTVHAHVDSAPQSLMFAWICFPLSALWGERYSPQSLKSRSWYEWWCLGSSPRALTQHLAFAWGVWTYIYFSVLSDNTTPLNPHHAPHNLLRYISTYLSSLQLASIPTPLLRPSTCAQQGPTHPQCPTRTSTHLPSLSMWGLRRSSCVGFWTLANRK